MRRSRDKSLAAMGTVFTGVVLFFLAGAVFYFFNERDFFSESLRMKRCRSHLNVIFDAKRELARDIGLAPNAPVAPDQLIDALDGGWKTLRCPSGGTYELGSVTSTPWCTIHGGG
jgi:hypothetical protein